MAGRGISILLTLKDKYTAPMAKVGDSTKKTARMIKQANNQLANLGKGAMGHYDSIRGKILGVAGAVVTLGGVLSVAGLKQFGDECISVAENSALQTAKLRQLLVNVADLKGASAAQLDATTESLTNYAGEIANVGVVSKTTVVSGMQQLATFQLNEQQIKMLTGGLTDLLAQTQGYNATAEDAVNVANLMGKAMTGNAGALSRVGIIMTEDQKAMLKNTEGVERANVLAQIFKDNVGGVNAALAKTDAGKIKHAQILLAGFKGDIGKKLLPIKAEFISAFSGIIPVLKENLFPVIDDLLNRFKANIPKIMEGIQAFIGFLPSIIDVLSKVFNVAINGISFLIAHGNILIPILAGIVAGFEGFKILTVIAGGAKVFSILRNGIMAAGGAMKFLTLSMSAFPLAWIALAIAAVVAGFTLLYTNCETFRNGVSNVWEAIKSMGQGLMEFFSGLGESIMTTLQPLIDTFSEKWAMLSPKLMELGDALMNLWTNYLVPFGEFIVNGWSVYFQTAFAFLSTVIGIAVDTIGGALDGIFQALGGVIDFLTGVFTGNWSAAWDGIQNIFMGIWNAIKGAFGSFIDNVGSRLSGLVDKISSIKLPTLSLGGVGHNATGTSYWHGGPTRINENQRGELLNLPNGTQIIPHDLAVKALGNGGGSTINVNVSVAGNVLGNEDFMQQCGEFVANRVQVALANS